MAEKKTVKEKIVELEKEIVPLEQRKRELEREMFAILERAKQPA